MPQDPKTFRNNMNQDTKIQYVQVSPQIPKALMSPELTNQTITNFELCM
jgi:hypothetical protein